MDEVPRRKGWGRAGWRRGRRRRRGAAFAIATIVVLAVGLGGFVVATHRPDRGPGDVASALAKAAALRAAAFTARQCLARPDVTVVSGLQTAQFKVDRPGDDRTYDARAATSTAYPDETLYPFSFGRRRPALHDCFLGGIVVGRQPATLTWRQVKRRYDGTALQIAGNGWYVVDGFRAANVEDGVRPRGTDGRYPKDGDGFVLRNAYFQSIRDDCISNTDIAGGIVEDSLFDGCYTGVSELPGDGNRQRRFPASRDETFLLDGVLLRLAAMPGTYRNDDPAVRGHGSLFKWSTVGNRLVLRNSVFLVETTPADGRIVFPAGTLADNVTVVWLGAGPFPGQVPRGVTVTRDRSVWESARARWLARHGCTSFDDCTRLLDPEPR